MQVIYFALYSSMLKFFLILIFNLEKQVYPVSALGGIKYISALKKPFPHISMVASQGITIGRYSTKLFALRAPTPTSLVFALYPLAPKV